MPDQGVTLPNRGNRRHGLSEKAPGRGTGHARLPFSTALLQVGCPQPAGGGRFHTRVGQAAPISPLEKVSGLTSVAPFLLHQPATHLLSNYNLYYVPSSGIPFPVRKTLHPPGGAHRPSGGMAGGFSR